MNKYLETKIIDDKPCKIYSVTVHSFAMGDVEDPDLFAVDPLLKWENSEAGAWVMKRAIEVQCFIGL